MVGQWPDEGRRFSCRQQSQSDIAGASNPACPSTWKETSESVYQNLMFYRRALFCAKKFHSHGQLTKVENIALNGHHEHVRFMCPGLSVTGKTKMYQNRAHQSVHVPRIFWTSKIIFFFIFCPNHSKYSYASGMPIFQMIPTRQLVLKTWVDWQYRSLVG